MTLPFDNVALAPGQTVPRMRSFPRNALTYAGICAVALPLAFFLAWTQVGWRRRLGWAGVAAALFGAGFSLARGAWMLILIGVIYLLVDGVIDAKRKVQVLGAFAAGALVLASVFFFMYGSDPLSARGRGRSVGPARSCTRTR